jgi:hypothetical protein
MIPIVDVLGGTSGVMPTIVLSGTPGVMPTIIPALQEPPQHDTHDTDGKATAPAHDINEMVATSAVETAFVVRQEHSRFRALYFTDIRRVDSAGNHVLLSEKDMSDFLKHHHTIVGMMTERAYHWGIQKHTLMTAVDIFDRYLARNPFLPEDLLYVGMVSLVIAAKLEERQNTNNWILRAVEDLSDMDDYNAYRYTQYIISMELQILFALDWNVCQPTYITFLGLIVLDNEKPCVVFLTCFLLELSLFEVAFKQFPPLMISASCLLVARQYQDYTDWPDVLRDRTLHTNALGVDAVYSKMDLAITTQMVVQMRRSSDTTLWVHRKYSSEQYGQVADVSI